MLCSTYKNTSTKVKILCPEGHLYNVTPNNFMSRNSRCPVCSGKCSDHAKKHFYELIEIEGYKLLTDYTNNKTKVKILCPENHIFDIRPNTFKNGVRCSFCSGTNTIQAKYIFHETLKHCGYKLLTEYINNKTKVKVLCPSGHTLNITPNSFKNGNRCPKCSFNCKEQAKSEFYDLLKIEGYKLLTEYINNKTKVKVLCPNNHVYTTRPDNFKTGYRCIHCQGSTGQRQLQKMLSEHIKEDVIYNDRTILDGLELDIYYPELKFAIEYQGDYWHNRPEHRERDRIKKGLCIKKGIKLVEIWDSNFMNDMSNVTMDMVFMIKQISNRRK